MAPSGPRRGSFSSERIRATEVVTIARAHSPALLSAPCVSVFAFASRLAPWVDFYVRVLRSSYRHRPVTIRPLDPWDRAIWVLVHGVPSCPSRRRRPASIRSTPRVRSHPSAPWRRRSSWLRLTRSQGCTHLPRKQKPPETRPRQNRRDRSRGRGHARWSRNCGSLSQDRASRPSVRRTPRHAVQRSVPRSIAVGMGVGTPCSKTAEPAGLSQRFGDDWILRAALCGANRRPQSPR